MEALKTAARHISGSFLYNLIQNPKRVCFQSVIRIHKHQVFPLCLFYGKVPGFGNPYVFQSGNPHVAVTALQLLTHSPGIIRGTIVHDKHFQIAIRLCFDALYTLFQIRLSIVNRHDHTDLFVFVHETPVISR